jgi:hypothetical protein
MEEERAVVLLADVAGAHRNRAEEAVWLLELAATLAETYGVERLAAFELTAGGELVGLLSADADPLVAVLRAALGQGARPVRWVCAWGVVEPGDGPAARRTGPAVTAAQEALENARVSRERLVILTGNPGADALLAGMAPALVDLLDGLTEHQRVVAGMALLDGMRQAEVAERLGIRRATTSVAFGRARVNSIGRLCEAMRRTCEAAAAALAGEAPKTHGRPEAAAPQQPGLWS